jgi:hypothetical protein
VLARPGNASKISNIWADLMGCGEQCKVTKDELIEVIEQGSGKGD